METNVLILAVGILVVLHFIGDAVTSTLRTVLKSAVSILVGLAIVSCILPVGARIEAQSLFVLLPPKITKLPNEFVEELNDKPIKRELSNISIIIPQYTTVIKKNTTNELLDNFTRFDKRVIGYTIKTTQEKHNQINKVLREQQIKK